MQVSQISAIGFMRADIISSITQNQSWTNTAVPLAVTISILPLAPTVS